MFVNLCGLFWGTFTVLSVMFNDMFAFFCGRTFGRTQLITLSPNKTLEGFLGGAILSVVFTMLCVNSIFGYPNLFCEGQSITFSPFAPADC